MVSSDVFNRGQPTSDHIHIMLGLGRNPILTSVPELYSLEARISLGMVHSPCREGTTESTWAVPGVAWRCSGSSFCAFLPLASEARAFRRD